MKIKILKENLKNGLYFIDRIIRKNLNLIILNNFLLSTEENKIKLEATNLETSLIYWGLAKIEEKGKILIPINLFLNFINLLKDNEINLESKNENLILKTKNQITQFQGINPDEFPIIPKNEKEIICEISCEKLKEGLEQISDIPLLTSSRIELSGVYFNFLKNKLKIVGTDSFRLGEKIINIERKLKKEISFIVPQNAVRDLISILNQKNDNDVVSIYYSVNQVLFDFEEDEIFHSKIKFLTRLIEGEFPKYEDIIPSSPSSSVEILFKRDEFLNQLKQIGLFSGRTSEVKIDCFPKENKIKLYSKAIDLGESESYISSEIKGKELSISFNYKFLISGISNIKSSEIIFELNGEDGPGVLKPVGDDNYIYVLMPIKA